MLSKGLHKKGCYICQLLDNVDMHMYAKFDQNIPCGSRVTSILTITANGRTDGITERLLRTPAGGAMCHFWALVRTILLSVPSIFKNLIDYHINPRSDQVLDL